MIEKAYLIMLDGKHRQQAFYSKKEALNHVELLNKRFYKKRKYYIEEIEYYPILLE